MGHLQLIENAKVAIDEVFNDKSVSEKEIIDSLKELLEDLELSIELTEDYGVGEEQAEQMKGELNYGKSCFLKLVMEDCVSRGDEVLIVKDAHTLKESLAVYRDVEPDRHVLIVMEDIDRVFDYGGEHPILELLDGDS